MGESLVSIIIPAYNAERYIERCLRSVEAQTCANYECICVDDGSVDRSGKIFKEFAARDQRFVYICQQNAGPSAARNRGLEEAKGEYILFVDIDDTIEPDYLEKLVGGIERSGADICCCGYRYKGKENYSFNDFFPISKMTKNEFLKRLFMHTGGCVWSGIYKRPIINQNGIRFNVHYRMSEDQLFKLQYFLKCSRFSSIDYNGYNYWENADSLSRILDYDKWHKQIGLMDYMGSILLDSGYSLRQVNKMMEPKKVNVVTQLAWNCNGNFLMMFEDDLVMRILNCIHVNSLQRVKYILPLKLKWIRLVGWVYS